MKSWIALPLLAVASLCLGSSLGPSDVTKSSGGTVVIDLENDVVLNRGSTLKRQWYVVHLDNMPIEIRGEAGVTVSWNKRVKDLDYTLDITLVPKKRLAAFEVKSMLFNIWGEYVRTVSRTFVSDYGTKPLELSASWRVAYMTEAQQHFTSITYINRVRTEDGITITADIQDVLEKLRANGIVVKPDLVISDSSLPAVYD